MKDVEFDLRKQQVCVNAEFNLFFSKRAVRKRMPHVKDRGGGGETKMFRLCVQHLFSKGKYMMRSASERESGTNYYKKASWEFFKK